MKIAYRLRFIPLLLTISLMFLGILFLFTIYFIFAAEHLPYQDPTPEMIEAQMEAIRNIEEWKPGALVRAWGMVIVGLCATILYIIFLFYFRRKRRF